MWQFIFKILLFSCVQSRRKQSKFKNKGTNSIFNNTLSHKMSTVCHRWESLCRNCMERSGEQWRVRTWHWQILECVNKVHFIEGKTIFDGQNVCLYLQKGMQKQEWASWRQKPLFFTLNQIEWLSQKKSREEFTKKREREGIIQKAIFVWSFLNLW